MNAPCPWATCVIEFISICWPDWAVISMFFDVEKNWKILLAGQENGIYSEGSDLQTHTQSNGHTLPSFFSWRCADVHICEYQHNLLTSWWGYWVGGERMQFCRGHCCQTSSIPNVCAGAQYTNVLFSGKWTWLHRHFICFSFFITLLNFRCVALLHIFILHINNNICNTYCQQQMA